MYTIAPPTMGGNKQNSFVTFCVMERVQRICIWINQNFLLERPIELQSEDTKDLHLTFLCLRNTGRLDMDFETDGTVKISTTDIRLAGDLVQSLAIYLNLTDLQVCKVLQANVNKTKSICLMLSLLHIFLTIE